MDLEGETVATESNYLPPYPDEHADAEQSPPLADAARPSAHAAPDDDATYADFLGEQVDD